VSQNKRIAANPETLRTRAMNRIHTGWLRMKRRFCFIGKNVSIHHESLIGAKASRSIWLGNDVEIGRQAHLEAETELTQQDEPALVIEDGCLLYPRVEIRAGNRVHLEKGVMVMQEVLISNREGEHENLCEGEIRIGAGSWIGPGAAIVSSAGPVTLGCHCVVNANAVVSKSAPAYSVLSGNPAIVVRRYDPDKKMWVRGSL
jgi:serine acetyltransferase